MVRLVPLSCQNMHTPPISVKSIKLFTKYDVIAWIDMKQIVLGVGGAGGGGVGMVFLHCRLISGTYILYNKYI